MQRQRTVDAEDYAIEYDPAVDAVVFRWKALVHDDRYRAGVEELASFFESVDTPRMLLDAGPFLEHREADRVWALEVCGPRLLESGAERVALVHSGNVLQRLDLQAFEEASHSMPGELFVTDDEDVAREWLRVG